MTIDYDSLFIGGSWVRPSSSETIAVTSPSTGEPLGQVPEAQDVDADAAVTAARKAFDDPSGWAHWPPADRAAAMESLATQFEARGKDFARLVSSQNGMPITISEQIEAQFAVILTRYYAELIRSTPLEENRPHLLGGTSVIRKDPIGVVAAIAPWNFPLMLESWKVAPALAWGNTVVLKPAEDTPASATLMARLALEAGLPPGVFNVLHGYGPGSAGAALTGHPGVDRITFTGESGTGRVIARAAAANLVPVSLELGGKGANIVFDDAGLDGAVAWSIRAIFSNAGQVCLAGSRLYVQRGIYEEFTGRFVAAAQALVVGDPKDEATELGPLASQEHYKKVRSYLDSIEADGGTIRTGGLGEGWVVLPTVVENAPPTARVCREEIFGPVVTITPFDTDSEAIGLANDTPYGLNAMVFTQNLSRAHRASAALKAGTVWVNCFFVRDLRAPFGGVGDSGIGREGGTFSREFFTEPKAVVMEI